MIKVLYDISQKESEGTSKINLLIKYPYTELQYRGFIFYARIVKLQLGLFIGDKSHV